MKEENSRKKKQKSKENHTAERLKSMSSIMKNYPCKDDNLPFRTGILMYLRRLYHHLDVAWEKELTSYNLTPAQYVALITVITNEGLSMSDLAVLCLWNRSTASRISRSLQQKELISISPVDGKTSALKVTEKGQNLAKHFIAQDPGEFKHSLIVIAGEAEVNKDVYTWLKNCTNHLLGKELVVYIEDTCQSISAANSLEQPLQSRPYRFGPSDS